MIRSSFIANFVRNTVYNFENPLRLWAYTVRIHISFELYCRNNIYYPSGPGSELILRPPSFPPKSNIGLSHADEFADIPLAIYVVNSLCMRMQIPPMVQSYVVIFMRIQVSLGTHRIWAVE